MALQSLNPETDEIRSNLGNYNRGHSDVMGNERADCAVKEATDLQVQHRAVSFRSACMVIKKTYADETRHARTKAVYSKYNADLREKLVAQQNLSYSLMSIVKSHVPSNSFGRCRL